MPGLWSGYGAVLRCSTCRGLSSIAQRDGENNNVKWGSGVSVTAHCSVRALGMGNESGGERKGGKSLLAAQSIPEAGSAGH